ncbi:MAG: hypothetical protein RSA64_07290, partial [Christensenellaceae bacterium]
PKIFGFLLRCKAAKRRLADYFERHQRCSGQKDFVSGALVRVWYALCKWCEKSFHMAKKSEIMSNIGVEQ